MPLGLGSPSLPLNGAQRATAWRQLPFRTLCKDDQGSNLACTAGRVEREEAVQALCNLLG